MIKVTIKKQLNLMTCYCDISGGTNSSSCATHCTVYPECGSAVQSSATYNSLGNTWGGGTCFTMTVGGGPYNTIGYAPHVGVWQINSPCPVFADEANIPFNPAECPDPWLAQGQYGVDAYDWAGGSYQDDGPCGDMVTGTVGTTAYCIENSELEIYCGNYSSGLNYGTAPDCFCFENSANYYAGGTP